MLNKIIGKIPFIRRYSTKSNLRAWEKRSVDWQKDYFDTWSHPHRNAITFILKSMPWASLWEVGVGGGANLVKIIQDIPGRQLGGCDVNPKAIEFCRKSFEGALFHVESGEDMMLSDKSVDIILTDMTLIYVGPLKIRKYLREFGRITRNYVVLVEFDDRSFIGRLRARMSGHHAHDYRKLLESEGYYDVTIQTIPLEFYPGVKSGTDGTRKIITARPPILK